MPEGRGPVHRRGAGRGRHGQDAVPGPVVVDFGLAAAAGGGAVIGSGAPMGSPGWMAPEQVSGNRQGPALDVFSWGLVVGFAATGRPPFGVGRTEVLLYRIVHLEPDLAGLDARLAPIVRRAVGKDPGARPTVAELLADLPRGTRAPPARVTSLACPAGRCDVCIGGVDRWPGREVDA